MNNDRNKLYDLELRTLEFVRRVIRLCKKTINDVVSSPIINQLVRAAGSVGANYREANEALSKKDFIYRIRISRKECKESSYWLELLKEVNHVNIAEVELLVRESRELRNIFTAIIERSV